MLRDYLREASKVLGRNAASEEGRFRVALRVFTSGHQTSAQALPLNSEFDNFKQRLLNGKDLRHRMAQQRRAQRRRTMLRGLITATAFDVEKTNEDMSDIEFFLRENKKVKKYSDFPTSPWPPGYVYLSEHVLVDILWANEDTKQLLERILPLDNPSKTAMFECVQGTKGVLIQALFCDIGGDRMVLGYRDKVSLQSQGKDLTRFKLKGTISTNGLVLNLLAYDTTQTKRQQQSDVDEEDPSQELGLSQGFLNTTCSKAAGEDLTDEDYANINWKRSSKLLENVELTFNKPGRCPSANTTTIVGCDPGIVNALTFSSLDPHNPNLRQTVKVRSRLYLPVLRFNHLLNKRKREKGMIEVESAIPVFGRERTMSTFNG
ncbi:hypothetical protein BCR41DRAFT_386782 [Lobosporangium transversale]|uniref:Uncharacterized protein n=1 Tax=Lobosporangium transversale TaxID=64571 RepID=A0A1Y2GLU5_9FUNG|nr:hypothetical protein BCR41DRAFT_386782 [Lobosporangium transversale]ORZ14944.1 hypothetical protein BCR41DRAFT_386782 [Lobosporangium transversale]|eukprot:XP_021881076.1 hypothetical protein BCR41DRAFT_386782 [Lobosporangium transversale]